KEKKLMERFRSILESKKLNTSMIARKTEEIFGATSPYYVPHNFCYSVASLHLTPHINQVFAISKLTGYSFSGFLNFFGFPPNQIPRLQTKLHTRRTVLLPIGDHAQNKNIPSLKESASPHSWDYTRPIGGLATNSLWPMHEIASRNQGQFVYVR